VNPFRRLLLGAGRLPAALRSELAAEGIVFLAEDLGGSIRYRDYRAPGLRLKGDIIGTAGVIVLTSRRLVVWLSRGPQKGKHIDVPLVHGHPERVTVTGDAERVVFGYDPAVFHPDRSGQVEVRLKTPSAAQLVRQLNFV
jgi:hypothetical protein